MFVLLLLKVGHKLGLGLLKVPLSLHLLLGRPLLTLLLLLSLNDLLNGHIHYGFNLLATLEASKTPLHHLK